MGGPRQKKKIGGIGEEAPLAEPKLEFKLPKGNIAAPDKTGTINRIPVKYRPKEHGSVAELLFVPVMFSGCSPAKTSGPVEPQSKEEEKYPMGELNGGRLKPAGQKDISVAVFSFGREFGYGNYEEKIHAVEKALGEHPETELIVTPEYFLYSSAKDDWSANERAGCPNVRVSEVGGKIVVEMLDETDATKRLAGAIEKLQGLAKKYGTNMVLGTFASYAGVFSVNGNEKPAYAPSLIVIDSGGRIAASHYKTTPDWDRANMQYDEVAMKSAYPVELANKRGEKFSVLPIICAEFGSKKIHEKYRNAKIDILAVPTVNGDDARAGEMTNKMQQGRMSEYGNPALQQFVNGSAYETIRENSMISGGIVFSQGLGGTKEGTGVFYVPDLSDLKKNYALDRCARENGGVYATIRLGR